MVTRREGPPRAAVHRPVTLRSIRYSFPWVWEEKYHEDEGGQKKKLDTKGLTRHVFCHVQRISFRGAEEEPGHQRLDPRCPLAMCSVLYCIVSVFLVACVIFRIHWLIQSWRRSVEDGIMDQED